MPSNLKTVFRSGLFQKIMVSNDEQTSNHYLTPTHPSEQKENKLSKKQTNKSLPQLETPILQARKKKKRKHKGRAQEKDRVEDLVEFRIDSKEQGK
jgi:hypothetical protein